MPPQYLILFAGPFIGIIYGIMVGIVAMSLRKIVGTND
jgi:tetrahydromethanopterin S-methyltransferase subunit G